MSTRLVAAAVLGGVLTLLYTYVVDWGGAEQLFNGLNRARALILESTGPSAAGGDGVEAEQPAYMIRGRPVERIKWEPTDAFAAHLVELGRPVVLTNTVVSTWPAVRNWREDSYLRKHAPSLPSVWNQSRALGPTFAPWRLVEEMPTRLIVEGQRSTIRMHEASFAAFARTANMHIDAAIAKRIAEEGGGADGGGAAAAATGAEGAAAESAPRAEVKPASEYMYYTDQIAFFPRLDGDASSRELLKYRDRGIPNGTKFDAQSLIWLSHPSVTAQPHYDESHNFFAQIRSTKLIMLFSPEQAERLYYNPHLHPAQRQSQVDFDAPNLTRFPRFRHLTTLVVTLAPGELLYIPPFWGHRVESSAEDMTISVSIINPSEVEARWKRIDRKWPAEYVDVAAPRSPPHSFAPRAAVILVAHSHCLARSAPSSAPRRYDEAFKTPGSKIVAAR